MPLQTNDFKEDKLSLDDFTIKPQKKVGLNKRTAAQLAASQTFLSGGEVEDYTSSKETLMDPERKSEFVSQGRRMQEQVFTQAKDSLVSIVADPSVSDEEKVMAVRGAGLDVQIEVPLLRTLAEQSIAADSGMTETERASLGRQKSIDSINRVLEHKQRMTAMINGLNADQSTVDKVVDTAELMAPFAEWIHYDRLLKEVKGESSTNLLGQQKQELFDFIKGQPIEKRAEMAQALVDIVQNSDTVVLPDGNHLVMIETLENMFVNNDYSNFERYFDNVTSILDITGVGALLSSTVRAGAKGYKAGKMLEEQRQAASILTRSETVPTSPSQVVKDHNPEVAREMHKMAAEDETGEAAEALYGTSREEAISKDVLPEPEIKKGALPNKVEMKRPAGDMDPEIEEAYKRNGVTILTEGELTVLRERIAGGLGEVEGMVMHPSSMIYKTNADESTSYMARFSPLDSGFSTPRQAIEAAQLAFRNYGMSEQNFSILARRGDEWVEADLKDLDAEIELQAAGATGEGVDAAEYAIGMTYQHKFTPTDIDLIEDEIEVLTTSSGYLSRLGEKVNRLGGDFLSTSGQGSIAQNLLDAASLIHPRIVGAASVAVDRTQHVKRLFIDSFEDFSDQYGKLSKLRRLKMTEYINRANLENIPLDVTSLYAQGFTESEVKALKTWRKANDYMWYASNDDMIKTLRANGTKVYTNKALDIKLTGRPVSRDTARGGVMYDPIKNTNSTLTKEELDKLYDSGGEVIRLGEPIEVDGQFVDLIISPNTVEGGYVRAIRDGEPMLAYREGYYPVMYDANYFLVKRGKDANGNDFTKTFAAVKNRQEAEKILQGIKNAENLTDEELAKQYNYRKDNRQESAKNSLFDEGAWNVSTSSGLSSQKFRGKRLSDGSDYQGLGMSHLKDPLEAVHEQIQQLSQRVSMRDVMDSMKKRWIANYRDHVELEFDASGNAKIPSKVSDIVPRVGSDAQMVASAKTNYNYIQSLESGYINGMDSVIQGAWNYVADTLAEKGFGKAEEFALDMAKGSPTNTAKTAAFKLFISSNPARQAIIQRGQMMMLGIHNPTYASTRLVPDLLGIDAVRIGLSKNPEYVSLKMELDESGVLDAVEAHELIRTQTKRMADLSYAQKASTMLNKPLDLLQKVGFGYAEQDVLVSAWLSARDKAIKAGKDISQQRVKDEILAETRAFTLQMNRAGEMPYSQNTLGIITQFLSFQHKAFLQGFANQSLSVKDRAKLLGYSTALFGVNASVLGVAVNQLLPQEPSETKDAIKAGLLDLSLNAALTQLSGEKQAIDFGDFAPTEAYGLGGTFFSLIDTPISELIVSSPSGSLLFGANPRINDAFKTGFKFFYPPANYEEEELAVRFPDVVHASMNMFSGYSSVFKANYAFQVGKKMSSSGRITDDDVTKVEAVATLFGFRTKTEEAGRLINEIEYGTDGWTGDDFDQWYIELKRHLGRRYDNVAERDLAESVLREAQRVFGEDRERMYTQLVKNIERDAQEGDYKLTQRILRRMGLKSNDETWEMINQLPAGDSRDLLIESMKIRKEWSDG